MKMYDTRSAIDMLCIFRLVKVKLLCNALSETAPADAMRMISFVDQAFGEHAGEHL